MDNTFKIKGKGTNTRVFGLVVFMLFAVSGLNAASLWYNGDINNTSYTTIGTSGGGNPCDSVCSAGGPSYTIFDNFRTDAAGWTVTGFRFSDFLVGTTGTQTQQTVTWTIWSGDPLGGGGSLIKSGTAVASLTAPAAQGYGCQGSICLQLFTVDIGAGVTLAGGQTYYLGTSVTAAGGYTTYRATTNGRMPGPSALPGWEQSNGTFGAINTQWTTGGKDYSLASVASGVSSNDSSFEILGSVGAVPEPGTWTLMGVALLGLVFVRRRTA